MLNQSARTGWIRCARASSPSSRRAGSGPTSSSAAAAYRPKSADGCRPQSRKAPAASRLRFRYDHENTPRTAVRTSPPACSRSSRRCWSSSSLTSARRGAAGRATTSSAAMRKASGSRAHRPASATAAAPSASARAPISVRSKSTASAGGSRSSSSRSAPSPETRPGSESRLVTTATQLGTPGSNDLTCSASLALSSITSIRFPASRLRYLAARSSTSAGMSMSCTPSARRNPPSASAAVIGWPGSYPRRFT